MCVCDQLHNKLGLYTNLVRGLFLIADVYSIIRNSTVCYNSSDNNIIMIGERNISSLSNPEALASKKYILNYRGVFGLNNENNGLVKE